MTSELKQAETELQEHGYHLEPESKAIDVVCGMEVESVENITKHKEEAYYFCSRHCKKHFDANPEMYIG